MDEPVPLARPKLPRIPGCLHELQREIPCNFDQVDSQSHHHQTLINRPLPSVEFPAGSKDFVPGSLLVSKLEHQVLEMPRPIVYTKPKLSFQLKQAIKELKKTQSIPLLHTMFHEYAE